MENLTPTVQLPVDAPLNVHFNGETKAITLTCYQFLSDQNGLKMELHFSPQATQQMLRALETLQTEYGINSEQLEMPHNVQ
ncbi:MAG: hypothetical protein Q4A60_05780 [Pasteurellaceae bacterium]|nr:hypothetical protein [Pasteurellaceae bacterium]